MVLLTVMCVRKQTCSVTYSRFQCECEPMAHFDDIIFELVIQRYIAAVIAFQCWIEDGGHFRIITHLFISIFVCIIWWRKTHHFLLIQCMHGSGDLWLIHVWVFIHRTSILNYFHVEILSSTSKCVITVLNKHLHRRARAIHVPVVS